MKYEEILRKIDGYGKYQKIIILLLVVSTIPNGLFAMVPVFILDTPEHHCTVDGLGFVEEAEKKALLDPYIPMEPDADGNWVRSKCKMFTNSSFVNGTSENKTTIGCTSWTYHNQWGETTAAMEWDMVCSKAWQKPLTVSLYMAGILVGSAVSGVLSDRFGRRPVFLWGTALQFIAIFLNGFCPYYILFTITMFLAGCTALVNYVSAFVLATELVDSSKRALVGSLEIGGFTLGYLLLPVCAYFITDWHWLMRFMGIIGVIFIPYFWWIPESPRWLIMNGRKEVKGLILKIAKTNGKSLKEEDISFLEKVKIEEDEADGVEEQFTYVDLLRHPSIRIRSLVMFVIWFTCSMVYYCISLGTSNLGGNKFLNCFVAAAVELPAYVSSYFLMERFGRRLVLSSYLIVGGIFCGAAPFFLFLSEGVMIAFSMVSKFTVTGVFALIYIMCCEMFPTKMRNMSVGASSTMARVGGIAAPYLIFAGENLSRYFPYLLMGAFAILSGLLTLLLPETLNSPLPETLNDAIKLDRYRLSPCRSNGYDRTKPQQQGELKVEQS